MLKCRFWTTEILGEFRNTVVCVFCSETSKQNFITKIKVAALLYSILSSFHIPQIGAEILPETRKPHKNLMPTLKAHNAVCL